MKANTKPSNPSPKVTVRRAPGSAALRDLLASLDDLDNNADTATDLAPFLRFASDLA